MSLLFAVAGTNIVPVEDDLLVLIDVMSDIFNDILFWLLFSYRST